MDFGDLPRWSWTRRPGIGRAGGAKQEAGPLRADRPPAFRDHSKLELALAPAIGPAVRTALAEFFPVSLRVLAGPTAESQGGDGNPRRRPIVMGAPLVAVSVAPALLFTFACHDCVSWFPG